MRFKQVGNKVDIVAVVVKNAEASVAIPAGSPLALELNATNDGLAVVLPATAIANGYGGLFGVALGSIANGAYGEAQVFGFCQNVVVLSNTRAATTDSWTTRSAAVGVNLVIDTVNNVFSTAGGTQAASAFIPFAILGASYTGTGAASTSNNTLTASTLLVKAFLRMM